MACERSDDEDGGKHGETMVKVGKERREKRDESACQGEGGREGGEGRERESASDAWADARPM